MGIRVRRLELAALAILASRCGGTPSSSNKVSSVVPLADGGTPIATSPQIQGLPGASSTPTVLDVPCRWLGVGASALVRYSAAGDLVGVASGGSVKVFGAADGHHVALTPIQRMQLGSAVTFDFSPDATLIAVAYWGLVTSGLTLFRLSDGSVLHSFASPSPTSVSYSPDGQFIALADGQNRSLTILNSSDLSVVTTIATSAVGAVGFSGDGKSLWAVGNNIAYRYAVPGWTMVGQGAGNSDPGTPAFGDARVHVTTNGLTPIFTGSANTTMGGVAAEAVDITGDGTWMAYGTQDGHVVLSNPSTKAAQTLTLDAMPVRSISFSPSGATVTAVGNGGSAKTWRVADGSLVWSVEGAAAQARILSTRIAGNRYAVGGLTDSEDIEVSVWELDSQSGAVLANFGKLMSFNSDMQYFSVRPDGNAVAYRSADESSVIQVDVSGTQQMLAGPPGMYAYSEVAYSPDGRTLAAIAGGAKATVVLWDAATGSILKLLPNDATQAIAYSPDGSLLGASGWVDPNVAVWRAQDDTPLATYYVPGAVSPGRADSIAFTNANDWIATGRDGQDDRGVVAWSLGANRGSARYFSVNGSASPGSTPYPDSDLDDVAFSPQDDLLAAAAKFGGPTNGTIVFRFSDGTPLDIIPGPASGVSFLDEKTVIRGEVDGTVTEWCLP